MFFGIDLTKLLFICSFFLDFSDDRPVVQHLVFFSDVDINSHRHVLLKDVKQIREVELIIEYNRVQLLMVFHVRYVLLVS